VTLKEAIRDEGADLMVLSHASNVCGTVQDLEAVAEICRERDVPMVLDAAQTGGVLRIDARALGAAAICFTGHKGLMGPQGTGGILWDPAFAARVRPLIEGGTGSFSQQERQPERLPDKFEAGTPNLPGIAGLEAALAWLAETGTETIRLREEGLGERMLSGLLRIPGLSLLGPRSVEGRLPVFAFNLEGWDNGMLALVLSDRYGIEGRPSLHCAPLAHRTLGSFPAGALRLSPGYFNTDEEIDATLTALEELARNPE
jgi:selenocysteine lyase/cysteine desulfurase